MKPRFLGLLAVLASLGFGAWLIDQPHSSRELLLVMVGWVLGFWVATGLRADHGLYFGQDQDEDEDYDQDYDEDYEEDA